MSSRLPAWTDLVAEEYDAEVAELHAIATRDLEVFSGWFARCEIPLKTSLRSFQSFVDVEAVVQDTAIKVWLEASRIRPDGRSGFLLRWARTVALNAARNAARRHGRQASMPDREEIAGDVRPMSDVFLRTRVQRCLERLAVPQQLAFRARLDDRGSRTDRELAASIGMSFDAFRQSMTRGRKALVACLRSFRIDVMEYVQ